MNGLHRPAAPLRGSGDWLPWTIAAIVPSVAAASTVSAGLWLSAVVLVSALAAALLAALLARRVPPAVGSIAVLVLLAALAGAADLGLPALHARLGIVLPLTTVLLPGAVAASTLRDSRDERRIRRALSSALAGALAFAFFIGLIALAREALGAGTITLPGLPDDRALRLPGISDAPARGLLLPLGGLIAAGYLAGLVNLVARILKHHAEPHAEPHAESHAVRPPEGGAP